MDLYLEGELIFSIDGAGLLVCNNHINDRQYKVISELRVY